MVNQFLLKKAKEWIKNLDDWDWKEMIARDSEDWDEIIISVRDTNGYEYSNDAYGGEVESEAVSVFWDNLTDEELVKYYQEYTESDNESKNVLKFDEFINESISYSKSIKYNEQRLLNQGFEKDTFQYFFGGRYNYNPDDPEVQFFERNFASVWTKSVGRYSNNRVVCAVVRKDGNVFLTTRKNWVHTVDYSRIYMLSDGGYLRKIPAKIGKKTLLDVKKILVKEINHRTKIALDISSIEFDENNKRLVINLPTGKTYGDGGTRYFHVDKYELEAIHDRKVKESSESLYVWDEADNDRRMVAFLFLEMLGEDDRLIKLYSALTEIEIIQDLD